MKTTYKVSIDGVYGVSVSANSYEDALRKALSIAYGGKGSFYYRPVSEYDAANVVVTSPLGQRRFIYGESAEDVNVTPDKTYTIAVGWEVYSTINVEARSPEEAFDIAVSRMDDIPLPTHSEYVDGSFRLNPCFIQEEGQGYRKLSNITIKRDGRITS